MGNNRLKIPVILLLLIPCLQIFERFFTQYQLDLPFEYSWAVYKLVFLGIILSALFTWKEKFSRGLAILYAGYGVVSFPLGIIIYSRNFGLIRILTEHPFVVMSTIEITGLVISVLAIISFIKLYKITP